MKRGTARQSPALLKAREVIASCPNLPTCRYVALVQLKAEGLSNVEIGERLQAHPNQVSAKLPEAIDWIASGCPPSADRRTWGIYAGKSGQRRPPKTIPALSDESRFGRLLGIIHALSSGPATAEDLARVYETTARTIQRDLVVLRRMGFEIQNRGRGTGFAMAEPVQLPRSVTKKLFVSSPPPAKGGKATGIW